MSQNHYLRGKMEQSEQYGTVIKNKPVKQGVLVFPLPSEENAFKIAVNAVEWALVSWNMEQWFRDKLKYGNEFKTADEALEAARTELREQVAHYHLDLDSIE